MDALVWALFDLMLSNIVVPHVSAVACPIVVNQWDTGAGHMSDFGVQAEEFIGMT